MLIGLTGLKGSGKDTIAAYLIKEYGFERKAFADILKRSAAALFGIHPSDFENWKHDQTVRVTIARSDPESMYGRAVLAGMSIREFLQRYGTESHRDIFGTDFWVDQLLPVGGYYENRDIVITDVRFFSETKRIHKLGGDVIRVARGTSKQDPHRSENEQLLMDVDYILDNTGPKEDIPKRVDEMLKELALSRVAS